MSDNTSEIKRVKFSHIIESQIPEFLNEESPFFKEFLDKYYTSVEHQSGTVDLATNLPKYRQITAFNNESLIPYTFLTKKTFAGSKQIKVLSTTGWPDKYGLLKIDNEIIVYKNKIENKVITTLLGDWQNQSNIILLDNTKGIEVGMSISAGTNFPVGTTVAAVSDKFVYVSQKSVTVGGQTPVTFVLNSFENCFRGFSGIEKIQQDIQSEFLQFAQTDADEHDIGTIDNPKYVFNLSNLFLQEFFTKFKSEFLPGFENRDFTEGVNLSTVLTRAKDFYSAKGTDTSYKVMFKLLYGEDIDIIKPSEYTLVPSSNNYFKTRNVLVEKLFGGDAIETKGNFLNQNIAGVGTVNASIYNIEYRPIKNKDFYEISLDSGSFSGQFQVPGKTKVLEKVTAGANNILVDSTIGFGKTGSLLLKPTPISDFITVEYNDKTSNQFLGVTGITTDLSFGADVSEDKLAYAYAGLGQTSLVQFRFVNVIDTVDFTDTSNIRVDDTLNLSSFGFDLGDDARFEPWIYNIPTKHVIKSLTQQNINTFRVELFDSIVFFIDEELFLINARNEKVKAQIKDIEYATGTETDRSSNKIIVQTSGVVPSNIDRVEKIIVKASHNANYFPGLENVPVGIQNSYLDNNEESFYITSGGVPNYPIFATDNKVFIKTDPPQSGTSGGTTNIVRSVDPLNTATPFRHNFVTGDKIFWNNEYNSGLATGVYFVTNINDFDFQLSYSASDVFAGQYIDLVTDLPGQYLYKSGWENQNAKNQKLLRKFPYYKQENFFDDPSQRKTDNKAVGILVNGVELYPSSVFDEEIFFGEIDSVEVTNAGKDYDVINGPPMIIQDQAGSGAIAYANVTGSFKEVKLISPGIGYQEKPKITVSGGNGIGAVLESNFVKGRIVSSFKADGSSVNVSSDTIDFPSPHNFELGEEIIYESRNNPDIGGIVDNSTYFARPIGNLIISLHSNRSDAVSGINTVNIGSVSSGFHAFKTLKGKNTITRIYVKNSGEGYSNKQIRVPARPTEGDVQTGISTADDYFYAPNHAFRTGEIVRYESTSIAAQGLSSTTEYFVTRIDNSKFKLTDAGIGTTRDDTDFKSGKITRISGVGSGTHIVKYPPIEIKVETLSGIGSTSVTSPTIEPVVLGSIESVYLEQGGAGYGCTNILNFHRRPNVGIATVQFQALLKPILVEGSIVDVQILASGRGYRKDSDIVVYGDGEFADISPIINEDTGSISGVRITDGGVNYNPATTTMVLQNRGREAKFIGNVHEWKINQEVKSRSLINTQDAALTKPNTNKELGLQFISIYPPNRLRFQVGDNIDSGNLELTNNPQHSPILGYAYDGNPIYGPYGFSGSTGGPVQRLTSSYILNTAPKVGLRPPGYSPGYFTDDYEYNGSGDLDEFGGRYCVTPQFPDGTYAYFYAIDVDSSGVAEPKYPYIIGRYFKDTPIKDNFAADFNQDQDITKLGITRNIGPYYTNYENSIYDLIDKVDSSFKQEFKVTQIQSAGITSTTIFSPGEDYRVGDKLNLDNAGTNGTGTNIVVSHVLGKNVSEISVGVSTFNNVDLRPVGNLVYGRTQEPHGLLNGETIIASGVSTAVLSDIEGAYTVSVADRKVALSEYLDQISATGITTFIPVTDVGGFEVNDIIGIGTEVLRVTFVDNEYSRLGVNRQVGVAETHAKGSSVELKPTRFTYDTGKGSDYLGFDNKVLFFDPRYAVGVGSTGSIFELTTTGIGTVDTQTKFTRVIPEKQIYIKDHPYTTGQKIKYNVGLGGTSLTWSKTSAGSTSGIGTENLVDGGDVYAINFGVDYLGISTVGFPTMSDAVYWYNIAEPVGLAHSFTTTNPRITGTIQSFRGKITTGSPHGLTTGNRVSLEAVPFVVENAKIVYDPVLRKITTNRVSWSSTTFDAADSSFFFPDLSFKSGDKVVYYGNGNNITELDNNEVYFVLRESSNRIKLCKFAADVKNGTGIGITAMPAGSYDLAKVNPPIRVSKGNILKIDVSDAGLADMRLDIFEDLQFRKKLDVNGSSGAFNLIRDGIPGQVGANIQIKTVGDFPRKSFYTLTPIVPTDQRKNQVSTDRSVRGFNSITVESSILEDNHEVLVADANTFSFNLEKQPTSAELFTTTSGLTTVFYETNSLDALGPIARTKINFEGKGYNKLPRVIGFDTLQGKNAVIKINSDKIGKIETTERIKDGFDYPTDPTLLPFLSVPTVIDVSGIARIQDVLVTDGGVNYHQPPNLKVLGNDKIDLQAVVQGGSVVGVQVLTNAFEFDAPLTIVPTRNTNGYDIDQITHSGDSVTVELLLDQQFYRPITTGYGSTDIEFPFKVGDKVYVEGCRLTPASFAAGELNFNSENYGYRQFDVTAIDEINFRVTYSVAGIATGTLGSYDDDFTLGYISNAKDLAKFQMRLIDDAKFFSGERITSPKFEARVVENGWDVELNQLRLTDSQGELRIGDIVYGEQSKLAGRVEDVNRFNIRTSLGISREKVGEVDQSVGILNNYLQRVSDNFYYQKFSYSIKSNISYSKWREAVRSIVHPSGFREFSDLEIVGDPKKDAITNSYVSVGLAKSTNMKVQTVEPKLDLIINIDNETYLGTRGNFAMVTEDDPLPDGGVQRVFFPEGRPLKSYILNKTNKVLKIDDVSNDFDGQLDRSGNLFGKTNFPLRTGGVPLFKKQFDSSDSSVVDLTNNTISIQNHNFQSGQRLLVDRGGGTAIGVATTSYTTNNRHILMGVSGAGGSSMFENGINFEVGGPVTGVSTVANPIVGAKQFGFGTGFPGISTRGTGATFTVMITYDTGTGQPISTNVVLREGGSGYYVGDNVSIAGTHLGGATPANDLTFPVTKISGTRVGIQTVYTNLEGTNDGAGSGAIFEVERDVNLDVSAVRVLSGGSGYAATNTISIAGTYIGGSTPTDNLFLTPTELGSNVMPDEVFVQKVDDVTIRFTGLSTSIIFDMKTLGTGIHTLRYENPNENALILVDGIVQSPIRNKKLNVTTGNGINATSQTLSITSGIGSVSIGDVLRLDDEFIKVNFIGDGTFVSSRTAEVNSTVDNNFYYDRNRANSTVTRVSNSTVTMDDNPPY